MRRRRSLRIKLTADKGAPFIAMFEPSGMTYELAGGEVMFADVPKPLWDEMEIVNWEGGISVWAPGGVITRDAHGNELDRLN